MGPREEQGSSQRGLRSRFPDLPPFLSRASELLGLDMAAAPTHKLTYKIRYACRPQDLYDALTDARFVQNYTQAPAEFDRKVGGEFTLFGGAVQGKFLQLDAPNLIEQSWRFREWPDDVFSTVRIEFKGQLG